ncbi:MAG: hypothetical protein L3J67_06330 [Hyphomicrobiaceae bacterium]|nr:hypothetical protein [Hyphomicrobiaceae bacterium]
MDVKEAVTTARAYFEEVFEDEGIDTPTLEEVWFDEQNDIWCVTMGIRRETTSPANSPASMLEQIQGLASVKYKTVRISNKNGEAISIRNRETEAA